jgi:hypothetical protein
MTDTAHVAGAPKRTGQEVLLATALAAATLSEDVNRLVERLYDFADWQLLNVTDEEALDLEATLGALHRGFVRHCAQARVLVADIDEVAARLGQGWAESDERFELSMRRLGPEGHPAWRRLGAWWRNASAGIEERDDVEPLGQFESISGGEGCDVTTTGGGPVATRGPTGQCLAPPVRHR